MKPYYVALTGSRNNAGDYLIKHRAEHLLAALRPDRDLVDMDGWKPLDEQSLATVNGAAALLLLGGPALQPSMHPRVYPLVPDLTRIRVPIIAMGIGWKHRQGRWADTRRYPLDAPTQALLRRIAATGIWSSVRDFHSLNVLAAHGFDRFLMTGCPATYDEAFLNCGVETAVGPARVAFSPGVAFVRSRRMESQTRDMVRRLRDRFADATLDVAFHHALDPGAFRAAYGGNERHLDRHRELALWLTTEGFPITDISGGVERMVDYYSGIDLHVGYRVHAHIFMASRSRPTALLAEDGRGRALRDVFGGMVVNAASSVSANPLLRAVSGRIAIIDAWSPNPHAWPDLLAMLDYELNTGGQRTRAVRTAIDTNYRVMAQFISQLP